MHSPGLGFLHSSKNIIGEAAEPALLQLTDMYFSTYVSHPYLKAK